MKFRDMDEEAFRDWVAERPEPVRTVASRWRPDILYTLKTTGQRVYIVSYSENGTVTVNVLRRYNEHNEAAPVWSCFPPGAQGYSVFGVKPEDLVEES